MTDNISIDAGLRQLLREQGHYNRAVLQMMEAKFGPARGGQVVCYCRCRCGHAAFSHRLLVRGVRECRYCACPEHQAAEHEETCNYPLALRYRERQRGGTPQGDH